MNKAIVRFTSVTYAMKAKNIVESNGGKVTVKRNSKPMAKEGCGYALLISGNIDKMINLFDLNRVKYIGYELI